MTVVLVSSPLYGDCLAIARTIQRDRLEFLVEEWS